jgi:hypothetical protein
MHSSVHHYKQKTHSAQASSIISPPERSPEAFCGQGIKKNMAPEFLLLTWLSFLAALSLEMY